MASRTDGSEVCRDMGFEVKMPSMSLVVDGGNVIRCEDKVIMVEKVFIENPYPMAETAKAIEEHFNAELIVLPWNKPEYFGHADGLVRYAGDGRVLQTDKVLLIPSFGCPEDEQAFEQIISYMPMYKDRVEMVPANDLIRHEGCLNCASWTVRV